MVSPFQFALRMSRAEEGLRGLWLTQDGVALEQWEMGRPHWTGWERSMRAPG